MFPINAIYEAQQGKTLGTREELLERFAKLNTTPERDGGKILYGPGIQVTLHPEQDATITTVLVDETGQVERELAQLSLERIERVFPEWIRADEPPANDNNSDTEEFSLDEFLDD
jgi:hypothetical protein